MNHYPKFTNSYFRPEQSKFPLIIQPRSSMNFHETLELIEKHKDQLLEDLKENGALLLRNFPIISSAEKRQILFALGINLETQYPFGISPRNTLEDNVFSSTEIPGYFPLAPHTEMSYLPFKPAFIAFHCLIAPQKYGETPLFDMRAVFKLLSKETKSWLRKQTFHYLHNYPKSSSLMSKKISLTWPNIFKSTNKAEVSQALEQHGFPYSWTKKEALKYKTMVPGIITHPLTQQECLNLLLIHPYATYKAFAQLSSRQNTFLNKTLLMATLLLGILKPPATSVRLSDGKKIPYPIVKEITDLYWNHCSLFPWHKNDLLLIDNISIAHGRMNVVGSRTITVSFGNMYQVVK